MHLGATSMMANLVQSRLQGAGSLLAMLVASVVFLTRRRRVFRYELHACLIANLIGVLHQRIARIAVVHQDWCLPRQYIVRVEVCDG
ncbi:hypothetical protein EF912_20300 [Streptomyces sp. WAC07061]|nr:hypothetical protein EF912_20300 [Streptomyces sp. WAC07061]